MYNYFMLIGRIAKDIEITELDDGKRVINLVLAVLRPFKNTDGTYQTDFFRVSLWEFLADIAVENLKKGSKIAVKGRLTPKVITLESKAIITVNELIGERLIFFNNPKNNDESSNESVQSE